MGLSSAARMVANASSSVTPYANVSGMFPIGAQPTAIGGTMSPVCPNGLRARGSAAVVAMGGSSKCEQSSTGGCYPSHPDAAMAEADRYTWRCSGRGGEMADTPALGAGGRKAVRVRIPLPAPEIHPGLGTLQVAATHRSAV